MADWDHLNQFSKNHPSLRRLRESYQETDSGAGCIQRLNIDYTV